jgi:hypothetical protein
MSDSDKAPFALETPYRTPEPNATIPLYQGRIRVRRGSEAAEADGSVELSWLPTPRLSFTIPSVTNLRFGLEDCDLELPDRGWSGRGAIVGLGYGGVRGQVDHVGGGLGGGSPVVAQLRLHLSNFRRTRGSPLRNADGNGSHADRTTFKGVPWRITIDELDPDLHVALRRSGGYALTHVLACERIDGVRSKE